MTRTNQALLLGILLCVGCGEGGTDRSSQGQDSLQPAACEPVPVPEGCEQAACEMTNCGAPDSYLDSSLCERKSCESQDDCSPDEECRWLRYLRPACYFLDEDGGHNDKGQGECYCGSDLMNVDAQLCLPKQ